MKLEILCKKDKIWRKFAFNICKDKMMADDLVQEMYLRFHRNPKETATDWYVCQVIKSLYYNEIKKTRDISIETLNYIESVSTDKDLLEMRKFMDSLLDEHLELPDALVLLATHETSLRKAGERFNVPYQWLHKRKAKALDKLKAILKENNIKL